VKYLHSRKTGKERKMEALEDSEIVCKALNTGTGFVISSTKFGRITIKKHVIVDLKAK
jgi:hypothetical protein